MLNHKKKTSTAPPLPMGLVEISILPLEYDLLVLAWRLFISFGVSQDILS